MNIPTREESEVIRVVVGDNTPTDHPILGTIPVAGTFPLPITKTGTCVTDGAGSSNGVIVLGTGTQFLSELEQGDFLFDENVSIRRIKSIFSDTMLEIEAPFPSDLVGADVLLVKKNFYRFIGIASTGTAAAQLNEQDFQPNDKTFTDGAPVSYDVSAADSELSFTLSN